MAAYQPRADEMPRRLRLHPALRRRQGHRGRAAAAAFTLLELLVVIGIIGILASISLPSIRALSQGHATDSGSRQLLDDLGNARLLALSTRSTVCMVFVPSDPLQQVSRIQASNLSAAEKKAQITLLTNVLYRGPYMDYALYSLRTVGDQPGRSTPHYLTGWKRLPDGVYITPSKLVDLGNQWDAVANSVVATNRPLPYAAFPFPNIDSPAMRMPYIAFDPSGQVTYLDGAQPIYRGEALSLTRGSILFPPAAVAAAQPLNIVATPPGNSTEITVNWLTGRARVVAPVIP